MGIIAELCMNGQTIDSERFTILAYSNNECVGYSQSVDSLFYLTVFGEQDEDIVFKAIDHFDGNVYDIQETKSFHSDIMGHVLSPIQLNMIQSSEPTSITVPEIASTTPYTTNNYKTISGYYSTDGRLISQSSALLKKGIYIIKYEDGSHRKIQVK